MPIPIDVFLWFLSKMPTLRFKIILSKKKEGSTLADTHLNDLKRIIAKLFNRFVNSDLLPYMMAPLAFLALMYLEWLYLTMLWCTFWSTGSRSGLPKLLVMSCSFMTRENWNHRYIFFGFPSQPLKLFNCHYRFLEKRLKETFLFSFFELWPTVSVRDCLACFKHFSAVWWILQVHPKFAAIQ